MRRPRSQLRWPLLRSGGAAIVLAAALAGCVSVPTSGPVESVQLTVAVDDPPVNTPPGPSRDAPPAQIVLGFLDAMEAYPISTAVATQYLTDEAAQRWRPDRATVVYDERSTREIVSGTIELRINTIVELGDRGTYQPAPGAGEVDRERFRLAPVDGQWRIAAPPDALFIRSYFFERYYEPFDLYFLDPTQQALVADPIFLPIGSQLTTQLVRGVLDGPTPWLGGQASSSVPASAEVEVSVPVDSDGVAEVQLSEPVADLSAERLGLLSAQLAWTLRQVPGVEGLRVTVAGAVLDIDGGEAVQPIDGFPELDPSGPATRAQLFALTARGGLTIAGDSSTYPSVWGGRLGPLDDFSVDRTRTQVAAVPAGRDALVVGALGAQQLSELATVHTTDGRLSNPQWDRAGQLWVLDHTGKDTSWILVDARGAQEIPVGALTSAPVRAMAVSADGARVAVLVDDWDGPVWGGGRVDGPSVVVARVRREGNGTVSRLDHVYAVPTPEADFDTLRDVDWGTPSSVSLLADLPAVPAQPYQLAIDGSQLLGDALSGSLLGSVGTRTLASAGVTGAATVVSTDDGRLLVLGADDRWSTLAEGLRQPHYHS